MMTKKIYQAAIALSTGVIFESGADVLIKEFGFSDEQAAKWIEAATAVSVNRMNTMKALTEAVQDGR